MATLKDDLDQYLLLQSDQKKTTVSGGGGSGNAFKLDMKMMSGLKVPTVKGLFGSGSSQPEEANGWLKDTQESCCPKLTRMQRIVGFVICIGMGVFCMSLSTIYIPVLILKARKFALLFSLGSLFFIMSFCFLSGFFAFFRQAFTRPRLVQSLSYAGSLTATIYFALWAQSTALTVLFAAAQIITLLLMILGEIPGGSSGLRFFGSMFKSRVSSTLPI